MPIYPLPQFEADLAEQDREVYERLKPPSSVVVRFGAMKMVGEFPYDGEAKPGCGSKLVVRTHRGTELGEMLTSTCPNAGCSKSVTRKEMLQYIENSGGKDYPFFSMQGRVLRIATQEDLLRQGQIEATKPQLTMSARRAVSELRLNAKIVEAEPLLGGERLTFYFTSEDRIDFRDLVNRLAAEHKTRIEMRQVGARDEARLVADYEKCGQHCCCKQFLKVLRPVSMKSAKVQKATLDPLKISGRCGRLMCCLRYEDQTYDQLKKRLPKRKTRVLTPHGPGLVLDSQILTQLVLVLLDGPPGFEEQVAVPLEDLTHEDGRPLVAQGESGAIAPSHDDEEDEGDEEIAGEVEKPQAPPAPIAPTDQSFGVARLPIDVGVRKARQASGYAPPVAKPGTSGPSGAAPSTGQRPTGSEAGAGRHGPSRTPGAPGGPGQRPAGAPGERPLREPDSRRADRPAGGPPPVGGQPPRRDDRRSPDRRPNGDRRDARDARGGPMRDRAGQGEPRNRPGAPSAAGPSGAATANPGPPPARDVQSRGPVPRDPGANPPINAGVFDDDDDGPDDETPGSPQSPGALGGEGGLGAPGGPGRRRRRRRRRRGGGGGGDAGGGGASGGAGGGGGGGDAGAGPGT